MSVLRLGAWAGITLRCAVRSGLSGVRRRLHRSTSAPAGPGPGVRLLVELGPTFVKGGQLLSTRADLLPPHWCEALSALRDDVGPVSPERTRRALERAYPAAPDWPFAAFDWTATASGSIACVHRARLLDGREVAVKIRRPGISRRMRADFRLLAAGAGLGQAVPPLRKVPMRRMVDQVGAAVLGQLDLVREAELLALLRRNLDGLMRVPEPLPAVSGDGVLVMEYVPGLRGFRAADFTREQRRAVVRRILTGVFRMLFVDGLVHCDMHPGNLCLTAEGQVVLLDAGFVVRLDPAVKRLFAEFFLNLATGRGERCAEVVLRSAEHVPPEADLDAFRAGLRDLVRANHGRTAGTFRLAPFATRLFDLQRRSGIAAAPAFVFPLLSLLVLEGMINDFDVDVDFQAEAIPVLLTALPG
ncbi:ABC1 kinase family protein [Symbioplanes lichenis]|uniref:ABC1 kinase family protein n=1 Tax=Symbioplanes lichenis TaxID=1629072 RepID=UPI002738ED8A|nr:AarF/UbiB family protein [Actinoplanes lichenis]